MCRCRRSACRAATRHDDDDDRRAPVSTFVIVSSPSFSLSSSSSPLRIIGRPHGITAISSIFPFTYARLSCLLLHPPFYHQRLRAQFHHCCHHLFYSPPSTRRFMNRRLLEKERTIRSVYARVRHPRVSVVYAARMESSKRFSCGLRHTASSDIIDIIDGMRESIARARARFPRCSLRVFASGGPFCADEKEERHATLYVSSSRHRMSRIRNKREKERGRNQLCCPDKFARAPFFARTRRIYACACAITYLLMLL